ncbi:MAG: hypothetical protein EA393_11320 [Bacteroidetes bacterium]|nr:MAG: hypothetical protein EA393_11320 [Bacteroidota bacterium]
MKKKPVNITIVDDSGKVVEIPLTLANDNWMRAARLARKAKEGDKKAEEELRQMQNTQMMEPEYDKREKE